MASIAKRSDGRWRARYRDATGREHSRHFRRKVDAQTWLDGVTTTVGTGTYVEPSAGKVTVEEWSRTWVKTQSHLKPSSHLRYEGLLRKQILPRWGGVALNRMTHSDVAAWAAELTAGGLAPSSVRQAHRVLSLMFDLAVEDGRLARNPAHRVKLPKARTRDKHFLTHEELVRLADAAGGGSLAVMTLGLTGMRYGELAALRVGRLDLLRRRLEVAESVTEVNGRLVFGAPKTHQRRTVPIPRSLVDPLGVQVAGKAPTDLVFTAPEGGVQRLMNWRRRVFDPAAETANLQGLTPHDLRHTAASLAVSAGANVKAVQRMLGHASAAMTLDVYAGLFDDDLQALADRMDQAVEAAADYLRTTSAPTHVAHSPVHSHHSA